MHLTDDEDLIFRRLIDFYMEVSKGPLPDNDQALANSARVSLEKFQANSAAVKALFTKDEATGKLSLKRCDVILADQQERSKTYSENGKKGGRGKINNNNAEKATGKLNASTLQDKTVQVLLEKEPKRIRATVPKPDDVSQETFDDFIRQRKTKFTNTALKGIRREAEKAGYSLEDALRTAVERGWQSFKADWVTKGNGNETTGRNYNRTKSKSERADDVLTEFLAEKGITNPGGGNHDSLPGPSELRHLQHIREGSGTA